MDPLAVLQHLLDTAVDPIPRIKAMFELTGKSEMWSAGQASEYLARAIARVAAHMDQKLHPSLLPAGARFLKMAMVNSMRRKIASMKTGDLRLGLSALTSY